MANRGAGTVEGISDLYPLLEAIVAFMEEGVIIADNRGRVLYQNPAAGEMLGASPNEPIRELGQVGDFDLMAAITEASRRKPYTAFVRFERRLPDAEGNPRDLRFHCGLVEAPGGRARLRLVITQDVSEQRRLEAAMDLAGRELVSNDPRMLEILRRVEQISPTNAFVLLQGESGTGKTQVARLIHRLSGRAEHPFVEVNCAAIPESLIESELFGHVKGAFTGATHDRPGRFQAAHRGTLFLDEVGEIPLHLQAKLLKAIQEQEFEMVGSDKPVKVDVRVISASNRNLRDMVDAGEFRADLYYRLAVIPLNIPPLRERPGDIPLLLNHFCKKLQTKGYAGGATCSPDAMRLLMDYPWPGNVREMENAIEHGLICAVNNMVVPESLPQDIREYDEINRRRVRVDNGGSPPDDPPANDQRRAIEDALVRAGGNRTLAARLLGVDRSTLWRRMQKLGLAV
jgi:PAS domain S-box-containing protein